jgi:hypothetical protein
VAGILNKLILRSFLMRYFLALILTMLAVGTSYGQSTLSDTKKDQIGAAAQNRLGLVSAGQVPGTNTNDNAVAGNVGEYLFAASGSITSSPSSLDTYTDVADLSLTLTPGDWDLEYSIALALGNTGVTGALFGGAAITDASNNVQTQSVAMTSAVLVSSGDQVISTVTKSIRVSISSTTTYKVRIRSSSATAGSVRVAGNSWTGSFTNPDNASTFYARRVR